MTETDKTIPLEEYNGAFALTAQKGDVGKRLDFFVSSQIPNCSRTQSVELIQKGSIRVNSALKKSSYRLSEGDRIHGEIPLPRQWSYKPEPIPLDILFEDDQIVVVNKPPGMVVHPSAGHWTGTLAQGLLYHCPDLQGTGGEIRPGIVHRLDKDTSGTIVAAKTPTAQEILSQQFKNRIPEKIYLAVVFGNVQQATGSIHLPIGRHPHHRKKMATTGTRVRMAETHWKVLEKWDGFTFLSLRIKTGRTHQIRVHCKAINHPIVGDPVYGNRRSLDSMALSPKIHQALKMISRQMLHAQRLCIRHPVSEDWLCFEALMPADMKHLIQTLRENSTDRCNSCNPTFNPI